MKRGFTIIELITSFVIISIVSVLLFNIIFSLKELYISGDIKTSLLVKQGIFTRKIRNDLNTKKLISAKACGVSCINFEYEEDGTTTNIRLLVDVAGNTITYGNYVMKLNEGTMISYDKKNHMEFSYTESILKINIPIKSNLLDDDFGIKIIKKIDNLDFENRVGFNDATIVANGVVMPITKMDFSDEYLNENSSSESSDAIANKYALFARIFHQSRLSNEVTTSFESYDEFIKSNNPDKKSTLKSLEKFRSIDKKEALIDKLESSTDKTIEELEKELSDGYFELLLDYPGYNDSSELENYNWWIQTSNFILDKEVKNSVSFNKSYSDNWVGGLKLLDNDSYFVTGSNDGTYFTLGSKNDTEISGPGSIDNVDLYVRVDEYIKKYSFCKLSKYASSLIYNITFNPGDGTMEQNSMQYKPLYDLILPIPEAPTDYSFAGWYTEENGNGDLINNDTIITSDITLYAYYVPTTETFEYTGNYQTFTALADGMYKIELWGGQGDKTAYGAYTSGSIRINKNQNLYIYVGRNANNTAGTLTFNAGTGNSGGWQGGGATDVRIESGTWNEFNSRKSRIMVAAGGGSTNSGTAGAAGGLTGYAGGGTSGGTQTAAGNRQTTSYTLSYFGVANGGCSGGNGYYPGGGATCANGAGGGSSFISGHNGCNAIDYESSTSQTTIVHTNQSILTIGGKSYEFMNTKMIDGQGYKWTTEKGSIEQMPNPSGGYYDAGMGHSGNGYAKITYLGP